jgi:hypothetical protein
MNTESTHDTGASGDFDARMRAVHAQAVAATPARVRLQLRPRAPHGGLHRAWSMAAAFVIGLVAVGVFWQRSTGVQGPSIAVTGPVTDTVVADAGITDEGAADFEEAFAALDESPELYLWLASSDASAMFDSDVIGRDAFDGDAVME